MRIVQLANFYSPTSGGLRTVVDTLGRGYAALGHERILVVPGRRAARARTDAGLVITVPGMPVGRGYRVMPRSRAVLKLLDTLAGGRAPMSVEVSDKTTLLAAGEWARAHGVGTGLFRTSASTGGSRHGCRGCGAAGRRCSSRPCAAGTGAWPRSSTRWW